MILRMNRHFDTLCRLRYVLLMTQPACDFSSDLQSYAPNAEDALALAMGKQWQDDQDAVRASGRVPDWYGEPKPLGKDKARLLQHLYEVGCIEWTGNPSRGNTEVTRAIGLNSTINARQVILECHKAGLIEQRLYRGRVVFQLTHEGEFALDEYLLDVQYGIV